MGDLDVDGSIILKWILENRVWRCGLDSSGLKQGLVAGSCGHDDEPPGSIKGGEFDYLSDSCVGGVRNAYSILVEKPDGTKPLGRTMCR
jgi:hypothetical protein